MTLDDLERLDQSATTTPWRPRPWTHRPGDGPQSECDPADAALIAAMRNALPVLLVVARAAERSRDAPYLDDAARINLCTAVDLLRAWGQSSEEDQARYVARIVELRKLAVRDT